MANIDTSRSRFERNLMVGGSGVPHCQNSRNGRAGDGCSRAVALLVEGAA